MANSFLERVYEQSEEKPFETEATDPTSEDDVAEAEEQAEQEQDLLTTVMDLRYSKQELAEGSSDDARKISILKRLLLEARNQIEADRSVIRGANDEGARFALPLSVLRPGLEQALPGARGRA